MSFAIGASDAGGGYISISWSSAAETGWHRTNVTISHSGSDGDYNGPDWSGSVSVFVGYGQTVTCVGTCTFVSNTSSTSKQEVSFATVTTGAAPSGGGGTPPPGAPTTPSLSGSVTSGGLASLVWTSVASSGYQVLRNGTTWQTVSPSVTSVTDTVPVGSAYTYRVMAFNTTGGGTAYSGQSNALTFSVPYAPALSAPTTGSTIDLGVAQQFGWTFAGPDPLDTQSQYELHYRVNGGTTWTVLAGTTPTPYATVGAGTFAAGTSYEWQVRTAGQWGAWGPWSASAFFTAAVTPPGPSIVQPTNNATIGLPNQTVTWSTPAQTAFQVRRVADISGSADTGTVYSDSGQVSNPSTRVYELTFGTNNRAEHVQVRVLNNTLWSPWSDVRVVVSYTAPAPPTLTLTANSATASIKLTPAQPTPSGSQPAVTSIDILRSKDGADFELIAKGLLPSAPFYDYTPASGASYLYLVRAYGANGTMSDSATVSTPTTVITGGTYGSGYLGGY